MTKEERWIDDDGKIAVVHYNEKGTVEVTPEIIGFLFGRAGFRPL